MNNKNRHALEWFYIGERGEGVFVFSGLGVLCCVLVGLERLGLLLYGAGQRS